MTSIYLDFQQKDQLKYLTYEEVQKSGTSIKKINENFLDHLTSCDLSGAPERAINLQKKAIKFKNGENISDNNFVKNFLLTFKQHNKIVAVVACFSLVALSFAWIGFNVVAVCFGISAVFCSMVFISKIYQSTSEDLVDFGQLKYDHKLLEIVKKAKSGVKFKGSYALNSDNTFNVPKIINFYSRDVAQGLHGAELVITEDLRMAKRGEGLTYLKQEDIENDKVYYLITGLGIASGYINGMMNNELESIVGLNEGVDVQLSKEDQALLDKYEHIYKLILVRNNYNHTFNINSNGVRNLFKACVKYAIENKRHIFRQEKEYYDDDSMSTFLKLRDEAIHRLNNPRNS